MLSFFFTSHIYIYSLDVYIKPIYTRFLDYVIYIHYPFSFNPKCSHRCFPFYIKLCYPPPFIFKDISLSNALKHLSFLHVRTFIGEDSYKWLEQGGVFFWWTLSPSRFCWVVYLVKLLSFLHVRTLIGEDFYRWLEQGKLFF
jgi:hypothetical protein